MKECETVMIDNIEYAIVSEVDEKEVRYAFLMNPNDSNDYFIRKTSVENPEIYEPLANDQEFNLACMLLFKNSLNEVD